MPHDELCKQMEFAMKKLIAVAGAVTATAGINRTGRLIS